MEERPNNDPRVALKTRPRRAGLPAPVRDVSFDSRMVAAAAAQPASDAGDGLKILGKILLSTQGRSFWILDLAPLHQMGDALAGAQPDPQFPVPGPSLFMPSS
jgi:hypothetical protein